MIRPDQTQWSNAVAGVAGGEGEDIYGLIVRARTTF